MGKETPHPSPSSHCQWGGSLEASFEALANPWRFREFYAPCRGQAGGWRGQDRGFLSTWASSSPVKWGLDPMSTRLTSCRRHMLRLKQTCLLHARMESTHRPLFKTERQTDRQWDSSVRVWTGFTQCLGWGPGIQGVPNLQTACIHTLHPTTNALPASLWEPPRSRVLSPLDYLSEVSLWWPGCVSLCTCPTAVLRSVCSSA